MTDKTELARNLRGTVTGLHLKGNLFYKSVKEFFFFAADPILVFSKIPTIVGIIE